MVDFLVLPPACAHNTFRCTTSPHRPLHVAYPTFWIPVGLVLTSRALPFVSVRLDSLVHLPPHFRLILQITQRVPTSFQHKSARCQYLPDYTLHT